QAADRADRAAAAVDRFRLVERHSTSAPALRVNVLFLFGVALAPILVWALRTTCWGLIIRTAGESAGAGLALGYSVTMVRLRAPRFGGFLAGIGGSFLSLFYPGSGMKAYRAGRASPRWRW